MSDKLIMYIALITIFKKLIASVAFKKKKKLVF